MARGDRNAWHDRELVFNQMARLKDKLVVSIKILYKLKVGEDDKVEKSTNVDMSLKGYSRWKECTTRRSTYPRQRPRESGCFWGWQQPRTESCAI